jgi:MFS family permease
MTQLLFLPYFALFALAQPGGTPETLGIVASVKAIGFFVIAPIAGRLADSRGRVKMIAAGTSLHALSYLFYVAATDINMVILGSLAEGFSIIHMPALQAITQESLRRGTRGLGLSATTGLQSLPSLVAPLAGGILVEWMGIDAGMRVGFTLALIVGLLVAAIRLRYLRETLEVQTVGPFTLGAIPRILRRSYTDMFNLLREYRALRGLVLLASIDTFFAAVTAPFWIVYGQSVIGLTTTQWGLIEIIVAPVNIVVLLFSGRFVDRFGKKRVMLLALLTAPLVNLSFIFCRNLSQVLLFRVLLTAQNAFIMPATTAFLADLVPTRHRGRTAAAIGWNPIVMSLGATASGFYRFLPSFTGSAISGYVYSYDPTLPWVLLAAAYAVECVVAYVFIQESETTA